MDDSDSPSALLGSHRSARLWCDTCPPAWTTKTPRASGLGVSYGAGDENRTRALSLGSDGACTAGWPLTCADSSFWHPCAGLIAPLLTVVVCSYGHAMGTGREDRWAERVHGRALCWAPDVRLGNAFACTQSWVNPVLRPAREEYAPPGRSLSEWLPMSAVTNSWPVGPF